MSLIMGGAIGLEREYRQKPAGLKTHTLICIGAAVFTFLSDQFGYAGDPSRIAAQVVSGIGFIGAGNMGLPMVKNLIKKGFQLNVYDINPKITKRLDKDNIKTVNNLRAVANNKFIISILPDTQNVESVFNTASGIISYSVTVGPIVALILFISIL